MLKPQNVPATRPNDRFLSPFDSLVGSLFASPFSAPAAAMDAPALDVVENDAGYRLKVDLPGMTQDQVDVQFADNVLTVQGKREEAAEREEGRWHVVERTRGSFARSVKFPSNVDPARVKAVMKNGVLTVHVPKAETARTQKIKVGEE
jgi:HSP20 family protein